MNLLTSTRATLAGMAYGGLRKAIQLKDATVVEFVNKRDPNDPSNSNSNYQIQKMRLPMLVTTKAVLITLSLPVGAVAWPLLVAKDVYDIELLLRKKYGNDPRYDSWSDPEHCVAWFYH